MKDYKVVYLADTHMYDWEKMFFESSAQRVAFAVDALIKEHTERGKIDLLVFPGDIVNNWTGKRNGIQGSAAYEAGVFAPSGATAGIVDGGFGEFVLNGKSYRSKYEGVSYPAGHSGTINDPKGVLRILSFLELVEPIRALGIPILFVSGNHDCYHEKIWEMAFQMSRAEGYLGGAKQYEKDASGNLLVPTYEIKDAVISLYTKTVTPKDADYAVYRRGYGTDYAFAFDDTTAYLVFDGYHNLSGDNSDGFASNTSGKNWGKQPIAKETVNTLHHLVKDYTEIYLVTHNANGREELMDYVSAVNRKAPGKIAAVMDGDAHTEAAKPFGDTGVWQLTCGYLGVPMLNYQPYFKEFPFCYRVVEKKAETLHSYTALFENFYPDFTFNGSSGVFIPAFYQPYTRRNLLDLRRFDDAYAPYEKGFFKNNAALFIGDSITAATGSENGRFRRGWPGRIAIATGMACVNRGVSGSALSTVKLDLGIVGTTRIIDQYTKLSDTEKAHFNYVILHGGVNDAWTEAPVGAVTPNAVMTGFATNSFAGALEELFSTVTAGSPKAKIGYIFNFYAPSHMSGSVKDMSLYFNEAKKICEKWHIPFLNMYEDGQLTEKMQPTTTVNLYDYIHPSTEGYNTLYPYIMYWLRDLPPYSEIRNDHSYTVEQLQSMPADLWAKNNPTA